MYAQYMLFMICYKSDVSKDLLRQTDFELCNFVWVSLILNGAQPDDSLKRRSELVTIINY